MVTGAADVLLALGWAIDGCPSSPDAGDRDSEEGGDLERRILRFLSEERHVNDIAVSLNVPVADLLPCLLEMEFRKLLDRRRGDYYRKTSKSGRPARNIV